MEGVRHGRVGVPTLEITALNLNLSMEQMPLQFPMEFKSSIVSALAKSEILYFQDIFRQILKSYKELPSKHQYSRAKRLKAFSYVARGVIWELFWYQHLKNLGFELTLEFKINGNKDVDFLAKKTTSFLLEVSTIGMKREELDSIKMQNEIQDALESKLHIPKTMLKIDFQIIDNNMLDIDSLVEDIQNSFNSISNKIDKAELSSTDFIYLNELWKIVYSFIPIDENAFPNNFTPVVASTHEIEANFEARVEELINSKMEKYDNDSKLPYLIAVGSDYNFWTISHYEIFRALFGEMQISFNENMEIINQTILPKGLFIRNQNKWNRLHSLVFMMDGFLGFGATKVPVIWCNPYYEGPAIDKSELFPSNLIFVQDNELMINNSRNLVRNFSLQALD